MLQHSPALCNTSHPAEKLHMSEQDMHQALKAEQQHESLSCLQLVPVLACLSCTSAHHLHDRTARIHKYFAACEHVAVWPASCACHVCATVQR